ncbi:hypothetical protein GGI07_001506 [Coemansia sp. Benny D115]|nr:hypothetical protein GGI07_001506 [Coemansia sp. Benny D115]
MGKNKRKSGGKKDQQKTVAATTTTTTAYAELYAASYSDDEDDNESDIIDDPQIHSTSATDSYAGDSSENRPTEPAVAEARLLGFQRAPPKLPAVRVGAARLSEMMMYSRRGAKATNDPESNTATDHIRAADPKNDTTATTRGGGGGGEEADTKPDLKPSKSCRRPNTALDPYNLDTQDDANESLLHAASNEEITPHQSIMDIYPALPSTEIKGTDELNGLLAPGALGDEKQKAVADGHTIFHNIGQLFKRHGDKERAEIEAKIFKPVILPPMGKKSVRNNTEEFGFDDVIQEDNQEAASSPLAPARVTYDTDNSMFGIHMPMQVSYEIHSGNFYPLRINSIHVVGYDGVTGNRVVETTITGLPVRPLGMQFHRANAVLKYLTSDMSDPALVDLFGKCAPKAELQRKINLGNNSMQQQISSVVDSGGGRSGALTIRFQIKVDVSNLGWIKHPIVTLNQNVLCPE